MRRKNLSEELEIKLNDDITLDDGSEKKEEEEKAKEKYFSDVQKNLEQKIETAEEIRDAEAPEVKANDGMGKALKIKQFTEKLILSEEDSNNILNEDLDDNFDERAFELRSDFVHKLYNVLEDYLDRAYPDGASKHVLDELYSMCEEAIIHLEDELF